MIKEKLLRFWMVRKHAQRLETLKGRDSGAEYQEAEGMEYYSVASTQAVKRIE